MNNLDVSKFAEETCGVTAKKAYFWERYDSKRIYVIEENTLWKSLSSFFVTAFLPHGFPGSVSKDYLQYQLWDSIQAFASSVTGSIATHAILKGSGVGDENASPLAATITWIIKDGTSMCGRILFAWFQGTKLDADCKKWRLFADILNDIALFLDLASVYCNDYFNLIMCLSGLLKSIVGVAGGATRAALTQHQALQNNMADVSAKDGSQETVVNLAALICSLVILPSVTQNQTLTWLVYGMMTLIHLFANYCAVKSVTMETFNATRFKILIENYLHTKANNVLTVTEVNKEESVFLFPEKRSVFINLGSSFSEVVKSKCSEDIKDLLILYRNTLYFLTVSNTTKGKAHINICLHQKATAATQIEAMFQACLLSKMISSQDSIKSFLDLNVSSGTGSSTLEKTSREITKVQFPSFVKQISEKGWATNSTVFETGMWRATW